MTVTGRIVAVALMIGGIALIGVVTATLASWIVEKVSLEVKVSTATEDQVEHLRAEIAEMKEMLRGLQGAATVSISTRANVESSRPNPGR